MNKDKNKYRINLYLGKKNYEILKNMADTLQLPIATITRILLDTGLSVANTIEKKDILANGK